ncbi:MAG: AMP-binding protein, partial [Cognaticolwellia aestuarii]
MSNIYDQGLDKVVANSQPLTPINFLNRTADVYPEKIAIIHGKQRITYDEYRKNVRRLASGLIKHGVKPGQTVSIMAANIPAFLDAHYGVPLTGAVLNAINIRLDAENIAFIMDHGECDVLLTDTAFSGV